MKNFLYIDKRIQGWTMSVKPKDDEYDYLFKGTLVICANWPRCVIFVLRSVVGVVMHFATQQRITDTETCFALFCYELLASANLDF